MSSVDNRVVEMGFNNSQFESKIATTMASLDKLKSSLDFANSKKGLSDLSDAAKGFNLGNMGSAIEHVSGKFLALSAIAITVLANITNRAFDAGVNLVKSLSLDPVMGGFREYETNLNSIQTILSNTDSKGSTLEDVTEALDILNTYADQTIYNFSEMARNIGTFTAAGVDLDTSVNAIKGIANVAAISGSNSQQASTAMYQLSQALATGSVKLMDWNSVVNAGMGGEVFQKALFETGKALGTIADTPIETTFEEWKDAGNSFRGSLETGWLTAEVLTNTLQGFTGDLTEAQLLSMGYTQEQAQEMLRLGELGKAAATEVKTLTQLIGTVQEAVGSGWSKSFQIIFGDFEEAKTLFTGLSDSIGAYVGAQADARNELLQGWKDLGGRESLIQGLENAFTALAHVIAPIKEAFREIFPPMTSERLFELTQRFEKFTEKLIISGETADKIKAVFEGIFSALQIVGEVVKEVIGVLTDLFSSFTDQNGGKILDFFVTGAEKVKEFKKELVDEGGIKKFFEELSEVIQDPLPYIEELKDKVVDFFSGVDIPDGLSQPFERLSQRFGGLVKIAEKMSGAWDWLKNALEPIGEILDGIFEAISTWFSELGVKLAAAMGPGDFDAAVDVLNVGLLGGIGLLIKKFLDGGLNIDFGGGVLNSIGKSFDALTGSLKAMQTDIKANALLKIAGAIALLTASVVVLSLIDSEALTKALVAMTVGFGQLVGAMTVITKVSTGVTGASGMVLIAGGMILLSGAVLVLAFAVEKLSGMDWEELAKGLTAVTVLLGVLVGTAKLLQGNSAGMILAGLGMIAIAIALNILAGAMKIFATMDWEEMAKGLVGVAGGLGAITLAMNLMPKGMLAKSIGLMAIGFALNLIAASMKIFATMDWEDIGKGVAGVAGGLLAIALAMNLMPANLLLTGAGLVLVGIALNAIAGSMKIFATMDWDDIGRGLAAMGGALLILALATTAMSGAIGGAIAIAVVSASLSLLQKVLKEFAKMSLKELGVGLLGMAGVLVALGLTALVLQPLIPALVGLGLAMLALGAGFALFGLGAQATAVAITMLAAAGKAGIDILMYAIEQLLNRLPEIVVAFAEALLDFAMVLVEGSGPLVVAVGVLIGHILDTIIELSPQLAKTLVTIVKDALAALREIFPDVVKTGFEMLLALLKGIRDNIEEITTTVVDIVTGFLDALALKVPEIIDSVYNLVIAIIEGVVAKLGEIASFLLPKGVDFLSGLLDGIIKKSADVLTWFTELPGKILGWIGDVLSTLKEKGVNLITGFLTGILNKAIEVEGWIRSLPSEIVNWIGDVTQRLLQKGKDILIGLWDGIKAVWENVKTWLGDLPGLIVDAVGDLAELLVETGKDVIRGLWNGILEMKDWIIDKMSQVAGWVKNPIDAILGVFSPSRAFRERGVYIGQGLVLGIEDIIPAVKNASKELGESVTAGFDPSTNAIQDALNKIPDVLDDLGVIDPTITPVLDLTKVKSEASKLGGILDTSSYLSSGLSVNQAKALSVETLRDREEVISAADRQVVPTEVKFEQTIISPEALSVADIYRQTKNQITMAKEELAVL